MMMMMMMYNWLRSHCPPKYICISQRGVNLPLSLSPVQTHFSLRCHTTKTIVPHFSFHRLPPLSVLKIHIRFQIYCERRPLCTTSQRRPWCEASCMPVMYAAVKLKADCDRSLLPSPGYIRRRADLRRRQQPLPNSSRWSLLSTKKLKCKLPNDT